MQNGEAIPRLRDLPTRSAKASTPQLRQRGPRRAIAIPGSRFQTAGPVTAKAAQQLTLQAPLNLRFETHSLPALARRFPRRFAFCLAVPTARLAICDLNFVPAAGPASGARRDTERKRERTSRHCIVRCPP